MLFWDNLTCWIFPWLQCILHRPTSWPAEHLQASALSSGSPGRMKPWSESCGTIDRLAVLKRNWEEGIMPCYASVTMIDVLTDTWEDCSSLSTAPSKVSQRQLLGLHSWWLESRIDRDHTEEYTAIDCPKTSKSSRVARDFSLCVCIFHSTPMVCD